MQCALCEDSKVMKEWFLLLTTKITEYSIENDDIYNFDSTRFIIRVAVTAQDTRGD